MPRHVRQGDSVIVVSGDNSKRVNADGRKVRDYTPRKVLRVLPGKAQVIVEGVNVHKKHIKPTQKNPQGGIIEKEMPIDISKVMPAVEVSGQGFKPTRVRFEKRADGSKIRVAVRTGKQIGPELKKVKPA